MNSMISAVGMTNSPLPAGGRAEGALFILFLVAAGMLLISGAGRLMRRNPHRRHHAPSRYTTHSHR